jgi:RNA polymerase sigma factor (sigma-70 family)
VDGVTAADIASLHNDDDNEINGDRREVRPRMGVTKFIVYNPETISVPDPDTTPEAAAVEKDIAERLMEKIRKLPEKQKNAIIAVYYQDLTPKEYAEISGDSYDNVRALLSRGIKKLRK